MGNDTGFLSIYGLPNLGTSLCALEHQGNQVSLLALACLRSSQHNQEIGYLLDGEPHSKRYEGQKYCV